MRRFVLWIAAILITFAIGVGADRLWWRFLAGPPSSTIVEPAAVDAVAPQREVVYVTAPAQPPPPSPPPRPHLILDYDPQRFSVWGVFYIMGPKPKALADIDSIEVMLSSGDADGDSGNITIYTRNGNEYDSVAATFGLATEQRLFFATKKLANGEFSYRFEGKFVQTDFDAVAGKNKAVLRGTLTKMKNDRTVTQHEISLRMEYMGC